MITFARRNEAAKTEQMLEPSPEHILGEDKSALPHERGQLVGLRLGESVGIDAGVENDETMAESLWEIASDKKGNAHLFQRMDERKRILRIGPGVGPEYRDLQRERFWKPLKWVTVLMNDFEQWDYFGSQGRRGFGGKFPNGRAPAQSERQKRDY